MKLKTWNLDDYHFYTVKWTYGTSEGIGGFMVLVRIRLNLSIEETWCIDGIWLPLSVLTNKHNKKWKAIIIESNKKKIQNFFQNHANN